MPASQPIAERLLSHALRRSQQALKTLPLLRRMAAGDIVLPERALNALLRKAELDEALPFRLETLDMHLHDGYFELDIQGSAMFVSSPVFRLQARFESVEVSLTKQVVRVRLLRDVQGIAQGVVQQVLLILIRAIFGKLFHAETLLKTLDRHSPAFIQESHDVLRIELHELEPVRKHTEGLLAGAAVRVLGRDTVLIHAIHCRPGELIIRTTTVAQELSRKALKFGAVARGASEKLMDRIQAVGRAVAAEVDALRDEEE